MEAGRRKTAVGYRGVEFDENDKIIPNRGLGTEGNGVYIADTEHLASFFGDVVKVEYYPPRNPLVVDEEPLYLLHEMDELFEPIKDSDSVWTKANKLATQRSGVTDEHWDPGKVADELTKVLKEWGYDGVRVKSGGEDWTVLFNSDDVVRMIDEDVKVGKMVNEDDTGSNWTSDAAEFVGDEYTSLDYKGGLYHVTTAKTRVHAEGLKSRKQTKTVGLGGGYDNQDPGLISVTFDEGHAQTIADRLQLAIKAARGEVSNQEIFNRMDQDYNFLGDDPYDIAKALGAPEETYDDWDAFNEWLEDYDPYELLQDLDNALSSIYTEVEDFGYRVGLTADKSALAKLNPDEVEVLNIEARVGATAKHVPDEAELRFRPEDVRVIRQ